MNDRVAHWNRVADGWEAWLAWTMRNFEPVTEWLRVAARWDAGGRVLDVGCGAGYPALAAAHVIDGRGTVLGVDPSGPMIAGASRQAAAAGVGNLSFLEMDAQDLGFRDGSIDAITNTYGLMFIPDRERALQEARRVLVPGGRLAVVVWDEPSRCPFFTVIGGVGASLIGMTPPRTGQPGPFSLAAPGALEALVESCGFVNVRVERRSATFVLPSVDEYLRQFTDLAWRARLSALSPEETRSFRDAVAAAAQPFIQGDALRLPTSSVCVSAQRAA